MVLTNPTSHCGFVFWNNEFIVLIEPFIMRIKNLIKNEKKISAVYPLTNDLNLCLNRDGETYLLDQETGLLENLTKVEYAIIEKPVPKPTSVDTLFYLQFGAFSEKNYARILCDSINKLGLPAFIDSSLNNLYRIKLGGFLEKELPMEIMGALPFPSWVVNHKKLSSIPDTIFFFNNQVYNLNNGIIRKE